MNIDVGQGESKMQNMFCMLQHDQVLHKQKQKYRPGLKLVTNLWDL